MHGRLPGFPGEEQEKIAEQAEDTTQEANAGHGDELAGCHESSPELTKEDGQHEQETEEPTAEPDWKRFQ